MNPNEMFIGMMAVDQLHELGLRPASTSANPVWARPPVSYSSARPSRL